MSAAADMEVAGLVKLRDELEELPGWPSTRVALGLLLYDVVLALGLREGSCARVLGEAWPKVAECVLGCGALWEAVGRGRGPGQARRT